ncbi:MAG: ABC transporter permease [Chloroflexi bacterium]|nr:ABC transporter permease [Chloroflexota bacterium]
MGSDLRRRLFMSILVLFGVSMLTFSMMHLVPGDPVTAMAGRQAVSAETIEQLRQELGLNDPLPVQYWNYISKAVQGDLGQSIRSKRPVTETIAEQLPATIQLATVTIVLASILRFTLGIISAVKRGTWISSLTMVTAISGISIPHFWLGLLPILLFSVQLRLLPSVASSDDWRGLILPAITLAVGEAAIITRLVRASMLDVLDQQYLTAARARGLRERNVILYHGMRNALIPVVTVIALQITYLLGGAIVVESIFARQGLGRLAIKAVNDRDFPLIQGVVLVTAVIYVAINTITDILYVYLDPRIRLQ